MNRTTTLASILLISLATLLLTGCPQRPSFPEPIDEKTAPIQATRYLSWHLRTNLNKFTRLAQQLNTIDQLKHFQPQSQQAIDSLLSSGMWQKTSLSYQLQQRFSQPVTQLGIHSILKKGNSLVMHMGSAQHNNISSQYNLVYNPLEFNHSGYVSNNSKDRIPCQTDYLKQQYPHTNFGSCYVKLTKGWYIHHSYQHL